MSGERVARNLPAFFSKSEIFRLERTFREQERFEYSNSDEERQEVEEHAGQDVAGGSARGDKADAQNEQRQGRKR